MGIDEASVGGQKAERRWSVGGKVVFGGKDGMSERWRLAAAVALESARCASILRRDATVGSTSFEFGGDGKVTSRT